MSNNLILNHYINFGQQHHLVLFKRTRLKVFSERNTKLKKFKNYTQFYCVSAKFRKQKENF